MSEPLHRVIFTCGGTAGHVNPAIALAQLTLEKNPKAQILFVGAERGLKAVQDMVAAINADGKFEVCSDLKEILGESYEGFRKTWLGDGEAELTTVPVLEELGTYNCYEFGRLDKSGEGTQMRKPPVGIASLNSDFKCPEIEKYLRDLAKKPGVKPELRVNQVVTVRNIVFQVIRLRKERV